MALPCERYPELPLLDEDRRKSLQGTWCRGQFRGRGPEFSLTPGHRGKWVRLPPLTKSQVSHPGSQQGGVRRKTPVPTDRGLLVGGDTMRALGKTNDRGCGRQHQLLREAYKQRMARGEQFTCWRCGGWVDPAQPWDLGHDDHDRSVYRGPEHRGRECTAVGGGNRATAGRKRGPSQIRRWQL